MYSSLSNNPFIDSPDSSSRSRYPDINTFNQATGGTPGGGGGGGFGYAQQVAQQQQQQPQQGVGYDGSWNGGGGYGSAFSSIGAQPTGFYGQQQQQQQQQFQQPYTSGSGYAVSPAPQSYPQQTTGFYGQQPQQPQSPSPYSLQQQQQQAFQQQQQAQQQAQQQQQYGYPSQQYQNTGLPYQGADYGGGGLQGYGFQQQQQPQLNLSEFDPLIGIGSAAVAAAPQGDANALGTGPNGALHPLKYIYSNKSELEKWNPSAWAGAVNSFVSLQEAWETHRKRCTDAQLAPYVSIAQRSRLQELQKSAEQNIDTVAAATLQLSEVKDRYRSSMDFSGRDQVRQALNAALKNLPSWPPGPQDALM